MKKMFWVCLLVFGFILNWNMVFAADVYVESSGSCSGETPCYSTIQAAINAANSGDTIKLAQGIYAETFVLNSGKQLILQGGWDTKFKTQTPRTTAIRAPIVTKGAIAFQELRIMEIAGPMGNATIADVLDGKTFSSDVGTGLTGVMPNHGAANYTPATTEQTITAGYYNGSGKVEGDSDLITGNIKSGVGIFGVTGTYPLAGVEKTGQKDCYYDNSTVGTCTCGTANCPSEQDGGLEKGVAWPNSRFTDNGNGTVADNLTGLIWLKNANCFGRRTWATALNDCNTLVGNNTQCSLNDGSIAGDWRLPNIKELQSLIDIAWADPALSNAAGSAKWSEGDAFTSVQSDLYWSSSTSVFQTTFAWYVDLSGGIVFSVGRTSTNRVWPVRGGQ